MNGMALAALCFAAAPLAAVAGVRASVPPLEESAFADAEVSTNVAFAADDAADGLLVVRLSLLASETNALAASFGADADGDGRLGPDERGLSLGWDCGEWFVREESTLWRRVFPGAAGARTAEFHLRLGTGGALRSIALLDGSWRTLALWTGDLPQGRLCRERSLLNVTSRGLPTPDAEVAVRLGRVGLAIVVQ